MIVTNSALARCIYLSLNAKALALTQMSQLKSLRTRILSIENELRSSLDIDSYLKAAKRIKDRGMLF